VPEKKRPDNNGNPRGVSTKYPLGRRKTGTPAPVQNKQRSRGEKLECPREGVDGRAARGDRLRRGVRKNESDDRCDQGETQKGLHRRRKGSVGFLTILRECRAASG